MSEIRKRVSDTGLQNAKSQRFIKTPKRRFDIRERGTRARGTDQQTNSTLRKNHVENVDIYASLVNLLFPHTRSILHNFRLL